MANEQTTPTPENNQKPRETNIDKIVHRHLQNKDDVITEEDIKYAKIDYSSAAETPTVGAEAEEKLKDDENKEPNDTPLTTWDVTT